ncbi:hypothetical protein, partial [Aeromicrobium alkaliterrae]|uniref:hypothetical protein n=1 Tax=Aeromicrobium alkaliterrae TaxID=302168 RepID=UPI0031DBC40B
MYDGSAGRDCCASDVVNTSGGTMNVERLAERLYSYPDLPAEVAETRLEVRDVADRLVGPVAHRLATQDERDDGFPTDVFDGLAGAGLF